MALVFFFWLKVYFDTFYKKITGQYTLTHTYKTVLSYKAGNCFFK